MYKLIDFFFYILQNTDIKTFILIRTLSKLCSLTYLKLFQMLTIPRHLKCFNTKRLSYYRFFFFIIQFWIIYLIVNICRSI